MHQNEICITDQNEIAKNFNKHFATIGEKTDNKIPKSKQKVTDYLKHRNLNSFFLKPVNEKEIQNIISNTANNKAVGPNSVPNFLLKQFKEELSIPLSLIINASFKTGIFPRACKMANIIPIYKKGDKLDCSNYRPISLLLNVGKIIEQCMHGRLYKLSKNL